MALITSKDLSDKLFRGLNENGKNGLIRTAEQWWNSSMVDDTDPDNGRGGPPVVGCEPTMEVITSVLFADLPTPMQVRTIAMMHGTAIRVLEDALPKALGMLAGAADTETPS